MLYKVTPMMAPPQLGKPKTQREPGAPRKRRKTAIFDGDGHEVLITLMCLKCKSMKPLAQFGLRKMADGAIRNQPWCRGCRSQAGTKPRKTDVEVDGTAAEQLAPDAITVAADPEIAATLELHDPETTQPMGVSAEPSSSQSPELDQEQAESLPLPHAADEAPTLGH